MVIASTEYASHIAEQFKLIQRRGGRAAIDYHNGELALMCTRPTDKSEDLGAWCCPQPYTVDWVRLISC